MFKELRDLFQKLDELDAEAADVAPGAMEPPPGPDAEGTSASRVLVFDADPRSAASLAAVLGGSGVASEPFAEPAAFTAACAAAPPPLLFIDVHGQGDMAIDVLVTISEHGYAGAVQL